MEPTVDLKANDQGPAYPVATSKQNQIMQLIRSWFGRPCLSQIFAFSACEQLKCDNYGPTLLTRVHLQVIAL